MQKFVYAALIWSVFVVIAQVAPKAQHGDTPERFTATAIVNNIVASGAGVVLMDVTRWSTERERQTFVTTLTEKGPKQLLSDLKRAKSVGSIRTPDSLAYDLRYAHQIPGEDGGRRIILATDRPIGFWEAANQPRTLDYPFTVVQIQFDADGQGKGTISYATKIRAYRGTIELEDFANLPVMLTSVKAERRD